MVHIFFDSSTFDRVEKDAKVKRDIMLFLGDSPIPDFYLGFVLSTLGHTVRGLMILA